MGLLITRIIFIVLIIIFVIWFLRQLVSLSYEKRIERYSLNSISKDDNSFLDKILFRYRLLVINLRKYAKKSSLLVKISKRYEKYVVYSEDENMKIAIDFVIDKILIGISFVVLTLISFSIQYRTISIFHIIIYFLLGYFILDIGMYYKNKYYRRKIDNDLLRSVIVINSAFKSGKSTMQALEIASKDLPEPIRSEYYKMYQEMKYGLSIDNVFDRFSKRIDIEEIKYISSSLSVLNKTGGNITKVFDSIEKTLFDKQKLREEMKSLTASSNLVVKLLMVVPVIFVAIIYMLNPTYFNPFFNNSLGIILLIIMIIMFTAYVLLLRKIMKVKV